MSSVGSPIPYLHTMEDIENDNACGQYSIYYLFNISAMYIRYHTVFRAMIRYQIADDISYNDYFIINYAIDNDRADIISIILDEIPDFDLYMPINKHHQNILSAACAQGSMRVFDLLTSHSQHSTAVDNIMRGSALLRTCIKYGQTHVLSRLLDDKRTDPSADHNLAIRIAVTHNQVECLRMLLMDKRTDPGTSNNELLIIACRKSYIDVIKLLLTDSRVDVTAQDSIVMRLAHINRNDEILKLLIARQKHGNMSDMFIPQHDSTVHTTPIIDTSYTSNSTTPQNDVSDMYDVHNNRNDDDILMMACALNYPKIIKVLIRENIGNMAIYGNFLLIDACVNGSVDMIHVLIKYGNVDPFAFDSAAFFMALQNGQDRVVRMFIRKKYVDLLDHSGHAAFYTALTTSCCKPSVINALMDCRDIDPEDHGRIAYSTAMSMGKIYMADVIQKHPRMQGIVVTFED